jgi:hypothetical protein
MINSEENNQATEECRTEEDEQKFLNSLIGMTITAASFSSEEGYMIEFDHRLRFRSCCPHSSFFRRTIQ